MPEGKDFKTNIKIQSGKINNKKKKIASCIHRNVGRFINHLKKHLISQAEKLHY